MTNVKPKKYLGQHFLKDQQIASDIVTSLCDKSSIKQILEVGPGMGVLTRFLLNRKDINIKLIEIDQASVKYLRLKFPHIIDDIIQGDFLKVDFSQYFKDSFAIIGNFPYNISSQIFFKILDYKDQVTDVVCMLQKEVAERLVSPPGKKTYGILSVFLQSYFDLEYLFTVPPEVFYPSPKVYSAVIRLKRNQVAQIDCDEKIFRNVVKAGFQNRRKTLRNALKRINLPEEIKKDPKLGLRAEQLTVEDFIWITKKIAQS